MKRLLVTLIAIIFVAYNAVAQVDISGVAKNYTDTVFYISEPGGFQNFTRAWRNYRVKVTIDKNGHFKATIPEQSINTWFIKTASGYQFFDLIKGKHIELIADFSKPNPLLAVHSNADDFNYSALANDSIKTYSSENNGEDQFKHSNLDSVLKYRKQLAEFKQRLLNSYRVTHQLSDSYYNWLSAQYTYEPYERTLEENMKSKASIDEITLQKVMEKGIADEYAALNTTAYNDLVYFYVETQYRKKMGKPLDREALFRFVADSDVLKGNTKAVFLTRMMYHFRLVPDSQYNPLFQQYDRMVTNREMKQRIIETRDLYSAIPVNAGSAQEAGTLASVFKKYRGKIIYVDFWASWCMPCIAKMPAAAALKDKLKNQPIVFLYLGYKDKEKAWNNARERFNIEGEHVLLTDQMKKEADEVFGIHGIPHYAIIDRKGNIVSKRADGPETVYEQLVEQLVK